MKKAASKSKAYTSFIVLRDKALEKLLVNAQRKINDELRAVFNRALEIIAYRYSAIPKAQVKTNASKYMIESIRVAVATEFHRSAIVIDDIYRNLLRRSYLLSSVGEAEALTRTTGERASIHVSDDDLKLISDKTAEGEHVLDRILLSFSKITSNLIHAVELSRIRGEETDQLKSRLLKALPSKRVIKRPRRALKPIIREADAKRRVQIDAFISDAEWQDMVDDYMSEFVPSTRGPESVFDVEVGDKDLEEWYGWDIERSLNHDFVNAVRSGQNDAANQNGIVDFSVIAIIDDHTCEDCCGRFGCVDFDGKTITEIEAMTDGEQSTPPFHFNCRCTMAPMLDNMPELEQSNEEEFQAWLNS